MKTTAHKPAPKTHEPLWQSIVSYLIISCGQLFVYLSVVTNKFLLPDDYDYFYAGVTHSTKFTVQAIAQNRLFNVLVAPSFAWIGKIDDMWIIRLIGLLGIFVLAICIFHTFKRYGENILLSASFALIITIMPAFQEYATWAVLYLAPWGAVVAYLSFLCMEKVLSVNKMAKWLWGTLAIFLLIIAYNIHPTSATFIAVFITIFFLYNTSEKRFQKIFFFLVMSGVGAMVNYIVFKIYLVLLNTPALERASLISDPLEKLIWFITRPLFKSINLIYLPANILVALSILFIIFSGLGIYFWQKGQKKDIWVNIIFLFLLVLLSYSSNLIIDENLANYRTLLALTGILAVMCIVGMRGYLQLLPKLKTKNMVSYIIFASLTVFCLFFAQTSMTQLIIVPTKTALQELRLALKDFDQEQYKRVIIDRKNKQEDKQGIPLSFYPTMVKSILIDYQQYTKETPILLESNNFHSQESDYTIHINN